MDKSVLNIRFYDVNKLIVIVNEFYDDFVRGF